MATSHAQALVRRALTATDKRGLPFAGPTSDRSEEGSPLWCQRALWSFEDYALNIRERTAQRDECHRNAWLLAEECRQRYGRAPEISPLEDRRS